METTRAVRLASAGALGLAAALAYSAHLSPLPRLDAAGAGAACKAATSAAEARGCLGVEIDLNITSDGVWVLHHDADFRGRPLDTQTWDEVKDALTSLDGFARDTRGERFSIVNLDLKERALWPGDGRLRRALEAHRPALEALAKHGLVVISSPVPARYAELHRFVARAGLERVTAALEMVDYDAAQGERWDLPMTRWEKTMLPVGGLANRLYQRLNARAIPWLAMQEKTAREPLPPGEARIFCWTRDGETGPWPSSCRWTMRDRN